MAGTEEISLGWRGVWVFEAGLVTDIQQLRMFGPPLHDQEISLLCGLFYVEEAGVLGDVRYAKAVTRCWQMLLDGCLIYYELGDAAALALMSLLICDCR